MNTATVGFNTHIKLRFTHIPLLIILLSSISGTAFCSGQGDENVGEALIHHITDSHEWAILPGLPALRLHDIHLGSLTIPVTQHVIMLIISALLLCIVFIGVFRKSRIVPARGASLLEPVIFFVRDSIVYPTMGETMGRRWLPFFLTLFFFILCSNLIGMIPLFGTSTANLSVTGGLALMIFLLIFGTGIKKNGVVGFFTNMMPEGLPLPIGLLLLLIEIPGLVIRSGVLAVRLFANMIAGHFVIYSLILLMFIVHPAAGAVSVPMALFIDLLELLVAIIQAIVFTMLSAIFIKMAVSHH